MFNKDFDLEGIIVNGLDISPDCYAVMHGDNNEVVYCNNTFADLFDSDKKKVIGATNDELLRMSWESKRGIKIVTDDFELWLNKLNMLHETKNINQFETDLFDGRWFRMTRMNLDNDFKVFFGVDITELKNLQTKLEQANQHIEHLANTDFLTNVHNRRYFETISEKEFLSSKRYNSNFALLLLDIDFFKKINDKYGHESGDEILIELAGICNGLIRKSDSFSRIGGEEFVILLPKTTLKQANILAESIRDFIEKHKFTINRFQKSINLTISIGISVNSKNDKCINEIVNRADEALYLAKDMGRNKVVTIN